MEVKSLGCFPNPTPTLSTPIVSVLMYHIAIRQVSHPKVTTQWAVDQNDLEGELSDQQYY